MHIQIENLTKTYSRGSAPALDGLNLEIGAGTFGLLGPNGAGKTTLIKILSTQLEPSAGRVTIAGFDLAHQRGQVRRLLGYVPQYFGAYPQLEAREFLDYMGRLVGLHDARQRRQRVDEVLAAVGLEEAAQRRAGTFSGGMMRRLGIAQAILGDPQFLIVDEPTVGLDPEERIRFRGILGRLSRDRTILISTHIVGDIASTCQQIAVLEAGRLRFHGPPQDLIDQAVGKTWEAEIDEDDFEAWSNRFSLVNVAIDGARMNVRLVGEDQPPPQARPAAPNLEDAYVYFMGLSTGALEAA
ncbi:MAG: ATP-binding cassette domain-containing protein [Candidatus Latescibacteria bacterium]|nr:ATP-binding cassette domain-containing protein [Candidatus Latescibacterota bacterium]